MTRMVIKRVRRETLVTIITRKRVGRILYVVPVENTRTRISNADEFVRRQRTRDVSSCRSRDDETLVYFDVRPVIPFS